MVGSNYTPAQASAIANLPLKSVHKLMDAKLIRPARRQIGGVVERLLTKEQLVYLRLEAEGVRLLPMESRREVAKAVAATPQPDFVLLKEGQAILVQVKDAREQVAQDLIRLSVAERMAVSDREIMRGVPVYRGTRIPVELVADMLAQGATATEIVAGYPALDLEKVELAPLYVRAFPRRGRPPQRPWAKGRPVRIFHGSHLAGKAR